MHFSIPSPIPVVKHFKNFILLKKIIIETFSILQNTVVFLQKNYERTSLIV